MEFGALKMQEAKQRKADQRQDKIEQKKKDKISQVLNHPAAIFVHCDGMRHVKPYNHVFRARVKKRWIGRTVLEVMNDEFANEYPDYYPSVIRSGRFLLNGKTFDLDAVFKASDSIIHNVHRHEYPVMTDSNPLTIPVLYESDELLVVDKPPSMTVHPIGRYLHNSVSVIVQQQYKHPVYVVNRLDRSLILHSLPTTA